MAKTDDSSGTPFALPADLSTLSDEELTALREQAEAEFDAIYASEDGPKAEDFERAEELATGIETIAADEQRRATEAQENADRFAQLRDRVRPPAEEPADEPAAEEPAGEPAPEPAAATASARPVGGARTGPRDLGGVDGPRRQLNPSLTAARTRAPAPNAPGNAQLMITASAENPGQLALGARINNLTDLGDLVEHRARTMPDLRSPTPPGPNGPYPGVSVARIRNDYPDILDGERSSPQDVATLFGKIGSPDVLVAAGGWCAPSQIRYDFFNIACVDGAIDLPTFGVQRGGVRFPVSPSLADVLSNPSGLAPFAGVTPTAATVPWIWTETDDVATVTGSANKPCVRIPCPSMTEVRLECYGICLTAGNLANDAWPENTRNFLSLLMAAHQRVQNFRYIQLMQGLSTAAITGAGCAAGSGTASPLLGVAALAATDIRNRFGMCRDDIIETVFPDWVLEMFRSDLSKRMGVSDFMAVTDAMIGDWFSARDIRAQFVADYQVRGTGQPGNATAQTAWPTTVDFLAYPPGTFVRGNGMTLDLGVVRDSTLNAENDYTAAWVEECHLIARVGHESRRYTVAVCTDGTVGAADLTACCP